jgi:hypothetical protein
MDTSFQNKLFLRKVERKESNKNGREKWGENLRGDETR